MKDERARRVERLADNEFEGASSRELGDLLEEISIPSEVWHKCTHLTAKHYFLEFLRVQIRHP